MFKTRQRVYRLNVLVTSQFQMSILINYSVRYRCFKCVPYQVNNKINIHSVLPMIFSSYICKCFSSELSSQICTLDHYMLLFFPVFLHLFHCEEKYKRILKMNFWKEKCRLYMYLQYKNCTSNNKILKQIWNFINATLNA